MEPQTHPRPRARAEVAGLAGYNFLAMVRRGFFYTFLLVYLREKLGLPVSLTALIGAANATTSILGQVLLWGRRSDRLDRRAGLMVTGELIAGIGYLGTFAVFKATLGHVSPLATTVIVVACLSLIELFWSMTDVGFRAAVAQVTNAGNRGRFLGKLDFIGLGGLAVGLLIAGFLYRDGRGIEDGSIWLLAAGCILAGVPLIRATLLHLDGLPAAPPARPANGGRPDRAFLVSMAVLAIPVLGLWSFQGIHTFFVRLPDAAAASDRDLSIIRMVFWLAGGLVAPVAGALVDRFGSRRTYALSLLACSGIAIAFLPTRSVAYAAATLAAFGAGLTLFRTASYVMAAELTPEGARGRCFALYNAVMSLGWGFSGLLIGGPVADLSIHGGTGLRAAYGASFVAGAALALAGLAVFLFTAARARPGAAGAPPGRPAPPPPGGDPASAR